MKLKLIYIASCLAALLMLNACKKDLGNYSYTTVNIPAIDTTGLGGARYITQYSSLQISPVIRYDAGKTAALRYQWIIYPYIRNSTTSIIPVRQLSTSLQLNATISEKVGEYEVELIVTDTTNQLKANTVFRLTVSAGVDYGLMVLHTKNDSSDVDFLTTAAAFPIAGILPARKSNVYSAAYGSKLAGTPAFVAQERRAFNLQDWLTAASNQHITRFHGSDFSFLRSDLSMFRRSDAVVAPQAFMFLGNSYSALINGGKLHAYTTSYETDALFSGAIPGDYDLAPYLAHGTSTSLVAVVYDKKYRKFIHPASVTGSMIDFITPAAGSNTSFDLRNIGKDMLYMDRGFNSTTHAFFKDPAASNYWLYVANFNKSDDGNMVIGSYNMSQLPEIAAAKYFQASELGYTDLYATDRKIYAYSYNSTIPSASLVFDGLPANETITCMRIFKPRITTGLTTVNGNLLHIATWNGTEGKIYEFQFNGISGQVTSPALSVTGGFGKITDIAIKVKGS